MTLETSRPADSIEVLSAELEHLLRAPFQTAHGPSWFGELVRRHGTAGNELQVAPPGAQSPTTRMLALPQRHQHALAVSLPGRDDVAACGVITTADPELARNSAAMVAAMTHHRLDAECRFDAYARQVTANFEELYWLQQLATLLQYCDANSTLEKVASNVLPVLRQLIAAEAVALIGDPRTDAPHDLLASGPVIFGNVEDSGKHLLDVASQLAEAAEPSGAVFNETFPGRVRCQVAGVRNCIVYPVRQGPMRYGWLVAINRGRTSGLPRQGEGGISEHEFGTFELNLVSTAAAILATHTGNLRLFQENESLVIGVIRALVNAMDAKDRYTCGHSDRVAMIAQRLAQELQLDARQCRHIYMAGLLHDIGKIGVPDYILTKPGRLTAEEFTQIQQHTTIGHSILKHVRQLHSLLPGVLHHHESVDGRGYPAALAGEDIPLFGRVLAVADAYDAMTSTRPYRDAMSSHDAERVLRQGAGRQWDAHIVSAFFRALPDIRAICEGAERDLQTICAELGLPVPAASTTADSTAAGVPVEIG
jgi:hypothetical protein